VAEYQSLANPVQSLHLFSKNSGLEWTICDEIEKESHRKIGVGNGSPSEAVKNRPGLRELVHLFKKIAQAFHTDSVRDIIISDILT
jgi:hypothetical protein